MSDLVDPFATHQPALTEAEMELLTASVFNEPWTDPARHPECLKIAWDALINIACGVGDPYSPTDDARAALRRMAQRADFGGPLDEPQEP